MSDELVLYSSPMSRGRIAHWMLEEVGVPYRFAVVNLESQDQKKPEFLAVNPMGKVPAIVHRGTVVTECGAICAYLADGFPAARLAPPVDSAARGTYYRWLFFGATCVEAAVFDRMLSRPAPRHEMRLRHVSCAVGQGCHLSRVCTRASLSGRSVE